MTFKFLYATESKLRSLTINSYPDEGTHFMFSSLFDHLFITFCLLGELGNVVARAYLEVGWGRCCIVVWQLQ
jgi:hypothetical protein